MKVKVATSYSLVPGVRIGDIVHLDPQGRAVVGNTKGNAIGVVTEIDRNHSSANGPLLTLTLEIMDSELNKHIINGDIKGLSVEEKPNRFKLIMEEL